MFYLCSLLTLWFFIWISKAEECQLTAQRQAKELEEIAEKLQETADKLSQIAHN